MHPYVNWQKACRNGQHSKIYLMVWYSTPLSSIFQQFQYRGVSRMHQIHNHWNTLCCKWTLLGATGMVLSQALQVSNSEYVDMQDLSPIFQWWLSDLSALAHRLKNANLVFELYLNKLITMMDLYGRHLMPLYMPIIWLTISILDCRTRSRPWMDQLRCGPSIPKALPSSLSLWVASRPVLMVQLLPTTLPVTPLFHDWYSCAFYLKHDSCAQNVHGTIHT